MIRASQKHLDEVNETYFEHLSAAVQISLLMIRASAACSLHAIIPAIFSTTASGYLADVQALLAARRGARLTDDPLLRESGKFLRC